MECKIEKNLKDCTCTYAGCPRRGVCCECVRHHRSKGEIPGCFFSPEAEKTYNRSVRKFVEINKNK